jgi:hypothetical protein
MSQAGDSGEALEAARRALAARDADLADADRVLAQTVREAHSVAVEAIGRIEAIGSDIEAVVTVRREGAAEGREIGRQLVAKNREIADAITEAKAAAHAKTAVLQQLMDRYRPHTG